MTQLFSVAALFIMYRESLEAAIVLSIMVQLVTRLGYHRLKKQVWWGAFAGLAVAIVCGVIFVIIFYVAGKSVFSGNPQLIFKGFLSFIIAALITVLAFALMKFFNYEKKWEEKLAGATENAVKGKHKHAIFWVAFTTVLREGIEAVLFLAGTSTTTGYRAIIIPSILGVILGILTGLALWFFGKQIKDLKWFFVISSVLMLFIAAGLCLQGTHFFQLVGWCGTWYPYADRPWYNKSMFTITCCNASGNNFWGLMRALFGYQDNPSPLEWMVYFSYWILVLIVMLIKWRRGTLFDAMAKSRKGRRRQEVAAADVPEGKPTDESDSQGSPSTVDEVHGGGLQPADSIVWKVEHDLADGSTVPSAKEGGVSADVEVGVKGPDGIETPAPEARPSLGARVWNRVRISNWYL